MRIFNTHIGLLLVAATSAIADVVTFHDGQTRLSGNVTTIHEDGVIELQSPLASAPVQLSSRTLAAIEFASSGHVPATAPVMVTLANNDTLPVFRVLGMRDNHFVVDSPAGHDVMIPRHAITSAQFGIGSPRPIFAADDRLEDWLDEMKERENWQIQAGTLVARGRASASHTLDLPDDFTIRFKLNWQENQGPDLQLGLCNTDDKTDDHYRLTVNSAGLHIRRRSKRDGNYFTLTQLRRNISEYENQQVAVEVHVMRSQQRLALWIDGKEEARLADPIDPMPTGNTITLRCNNPSGTRQTISGLEILDFNNAHARQLEEDRGNPDADIIISRDDERWPGKLLGIMTTPEGTFLSFDTDFIDHPMEIALADVSTLRLARANSSTTTDGMMAVHLHGDGLLHVTSCTLAQGRLQTTHPLLGPLDIEQAHVKSITRVAAGPETQATE